MNSPALHRAVALASLALALCACSSGPATPTDAATDGASDMGVALDAPGGDGSTMCTTQAMCDDGTYCNGPEQCAPGTAGADALGCVHGTPPCTMSQMCSEATRTCTPLTCTHMATPDMDMDGHADILCGGDDCDDTDPHRYPGNPEVCLVGTAADGTLTRTGAAMVAGVAVTLDPTHDEDCDPTTYASATTHDGDHDGDGFVDTACANTDRSGGRNQGNDCDDLATTMGVAPGEIHPMQTETCNGVDDNCNGTIDEGVRVTYYPDCDGDHHGAAAGAMAGLCAPPTMAPSCPAGEAGAWVTVGDDCDDTRATTYPTATEACNGVDDDCNGTVDDVAAAVAWCSAQPHVTSAMCAAGACVFACTGPSLDCTSAPGCETDPNSDPAHCGACAHACVHPTCTASVCTRDFVEIAAAGMHTCGRRADGSVACWGSNVGGELGDGTTIERHAPVAVVVVTNAAHVALGFSDTFATSTTRGSYAWGRNTDGELGSGLTTDEATPYSVLSRNVVQFAAGDAHTCALDSSGAVSCVGSNANGQFGDGTTTARTAFGFSQVTGLTDAVQIACGSAGTCARRASGAVSCWGRNGLGEVGDGTTTERHAPAAVVGLTDAAQLVVGSSHACARRASGAVLCWGSNTVDQLGDGTMVSRSSPVTVLGLSDATSLAAGYGHTCAIRASGSVVCWGLNNAGQLGDGTTTNQTSPVAVPGLTNVVALTAGYGHTCALRGSGVVVCWGSNSTGQLGDGTVADRSAPTPIADP